MQKQHPTNIWKFLSKNKKVLLLIAILFLGFYPRLKAMQSEKVDFDEMTYVAASLDYQKMMMEGNISAITHYDNYQLVNNTYSWHWTPHLYESPSFGKIVYSTAFIIAQPKNELQALSVSRFTSYLYSNMIIILLFIVHPLAALFFAVDEWAIWYGSIAYLEAIWMSFALLSLIFFIKSYKKQNPYLYLSAVALGLSFASKYLAAITMMTIGIFLLLRFAKKPKYLLLYGIIFISTFYAADVQIWNNPIQDTYVSFLFFEEYPQTEQVQKSGLSWHSLWDYLNKDKPGNASMFLSLHRWIFYLSILGLPLLFKKNKIFFTWYMLNFLFLFFYPVKWEQYVFIILPAMVISAGYLVAWMYQYARVLCSKTKRRA